MNVVEVVRRSLPFERLLDCIRPMDYIDHPNIIRVDARRWKHVLEIVENGVDGVEWRYLIRAR